MVWRGAPTVGQDNEKILKELLGYDNKKIEELKGKELI
jgi:crotonobetainyl-CoA:carnitine CoA-transferase CaiB-like acyl-CoA transferase